MKIEYNFTYGITVGTDAELSISSNSNNPTVDFAQELQYELLIKIDKAGYEPKSRPWINQEQESNRLKVTVSAKSRSGVNRETAIAVLERFCFKRSSDNY